MSAVNTMSMLILLSLLAPAAHGETKDNAADEADWELVWSDEFDQPGAPDEARWTFEEGFRRNREAQYYTGENAEVVDGKLVITARKERVQNEAFEPHSRERNRKFAEFTSASLHTRGKASWVGGRVEVRAKVPGGRGTWPAIWMLGTNIREVGWPTCGEIDIMEHVGFDPQRVHANIHTARYNHVDETGKGAHLDLEDASQFHVYRVDWSAEALEFYVDDVGFFTFRREPHVEGAWPFDQPHYLILNLAIGGTWGGREGIDESIFPVDYQIDYVRVYQRQ